MKRKKIIPTTPTVEETIEFIKKAHAGQKDKSGVPYWKHPFGVLELLDKSMSEFGGVYDFERCAALLHDVVEDTKYTLKELLMLGFDKKTVEIVRLVSRFPEDGTYFQWIQSIVDHGNHRAIRIKILDIRHNSLPARIEGLSNSERGILKRYVKALAILEPVYWDAALNQPEYILLNIAAHKIKRKALVK